MFSAKKKIFPSCFLQREEGLLITQLGRQGCPLLGKSRILHGSGAWHKEWEGSGLVQVTAGTARPDSTARRASMLLRLKGLEGGRFQAGPRFHIR